MQSSSLRWTNGIADHQGTFERRFQSHINGDSDSHSGSNGQYGNPPFSTGNGSVGGFDSGHSPRTHNIGNDCTQASGVPHSAAKDTESFDQEMDQSESVSSLVEDSSSANRSN